MGRVGLATALGAVLCVVGCFLLLIILIGSDDNQQSGLQGTPGVVCAPASGGAGARVSGINDVQLAHAAAIVSAGDELNVPQRGKVVAIATALQESGLKMYANSGNPESLALAHDAVGRDHDSVGLFQQRASWGSTQVRMDAKASAKLFYQRLLAIRGWEALPLAAAAQRVQISAFPDAYAKWEAKANEIVGAVLGITCAPGGNAGAPPNPLARAAIDRAMSQVGVPYAWGGGNANGPTRGISDNGGPADRAGDSRKVGFDCSGLMVFAFASQGISVPHQTKAIWATFGPPITDRAQIQPGDMILLSANQRPNGINHVGLYLGDGRVIHAPESGSTVRVVEDIWSNQFWTSHFVGAVRPRPAPQVDPT